MNVQIRVWDQTDNQFDAEVIGVEASENGDLSWDRVEVVYDRIGGDYQPGTRIVIGEPDPLGVFDLFGGYSDENALYCAIFKQYHGLQGYWSEPGR